MPTNDIANGSNEPDLFGSSRPPAISVNETSEVEPNPGINREVTEDDPVTSSDPEGVERYDDIDMPDPMKDGTKNLPDSWEGPRTVPDDLDLDEKYISDRELDAAGQEGGGGAALPSLLKFGRMAVPVQRTRLWQFALGTSANVPPTVIADRAREIEAMGQIRTCRGRLVKGQVEIVTGLLDVLAVREIAAAGREPYTVVVDIEPMDDENAFKIAYGEAAEGLPLAPVDHAMFVREAIATVFKTQRAMAERLGLHESNVSRLLKVDRCALIVGDKVTDPWTISIARAERFMRLHEDAAIRKPLLAFVKVADPQTARALFKAVFARFDPPSPKANADADAVIVANDKGDDLGRLGQDRDGGVTIRLVKAAGQVELQDLVRFVENALSELRRKAA